MRLSQVRTIIYPQMSLRTIEYKVPFLNNISQEWEVHTYFVQGMKCEYDWYFLETSGQWLVPFPPLGAAPASIHWSTIWCNQHVYT